MIDMFHFPRVTNGSPETQINELITYLIHFKETLEFALMNISTENLSPEIEKVTRYITENLSEDISLETLADIAGFEKNYFSIVLVCFRTSSILPARYAYARSSLST